MVQPRIVLPVKLFSSFAPHPAGQWTWETINGTAKDSDNPKLLVMQTTCEIHSPGKAEGGVNDWVK